MAEADLIPLSSFQSIVVPGNPTTTVSIKKFVESQKLEFAKGAGFYQLIKPEIIQLNKRVLVQRINNPEMLLTGNKVKEVLEMNNNNTSKNKKNGKYNIDENVLKEFHVFVQSTSYNRNLYGQSLFLYQKEGSNDPFQVQNTAATSVAANAGGVGVKRGATTNQEASVEKRARDGVAEVQTSSSSGCGPNSSGTISDKIEIVFSFDTTASMYPCLSIVRDVLSDTVQKLTTQIPGINIGLIAHGDYDTSYTIKSANDYKFCTGTEIQILDQFVKSVGTNPGYTPPECYEFVLHQARTKYNWSPNSNKALVLIGDERPHEANDNPHGIDWKHEAQELKTAGIRVYAVQCLDRSLATTFYKQVAELTDGFHLKLHQFSSIVDFLTAVCFHEGDTAQGDNQLVSNFETEITSAGRMVRNLRQLFDQLQGREPTQGTPIEEGLIPVSPSRFQVLVIDQDQAIKQFAESRGLVFKAGRGFYEFTKPEAISDKKEIILMDKSTGDFFTGWEAARKFAKIVPGNSNKKQIPQGDEKFVAFIQSTSYNRKLIAGQRFLYEVDPDG